MTTTGNADFLNELNETDSITALQSASSQKSTFVFKLAEYPSPFQTSIVSFINKRVVLGKEIGDLLFDMNQIVSIKFNVGTEVFFVKTQLKRHVDKVYFDMTSKVMQLKRRKEPRYLIPKKWNQSASILNKINLSNLVKAQVQDISISGIRFELAETNIQFKSQDLVKIQFQIYKRAAMSADAIVRFYANRPGHGAIMGMEFYNLKDVQKERVMHIVNDITNFQSTQKF